MGKLAMAENNNTPTKPCLKCGSDLFWQDRQVGNIHCGDCFEPPSISVAAKWWRVVAVDSEQPDESVDLFAEPSEVDLFAEPIKNQQSAQWDAVEIHIGEKTSANGSNGKQAGIASDTVSDDLTPEARWGFDHGIASEATADAIMWFTQRRLDGMLENAMRSAGVWHSSDKKRVRPPKTPTGAEEYYLLRNGRIVIGVKQAAKFKTVIAMTFDGANQWWEAEPKARSEKPVSEVKANKP